MKCHEQQNNTTYTFQDNDFTCILISHGGGDPSGIPRASFNSCDNMPGFISLNFTCTASNITMSYNMTLQPINGQISSEGFKMM
jgi:hypothetical protein